MKLSTIYGALAIGLLASSVYAKPSQLEVNWRYQDAQSNTRVSGNSGLDFSSSEDSRSDARIAKTLFMVRFGSALKDSLEQFEKACAPKPGPIGLEKAGSILPPMPPFPRPVPKCETDRLQVAQALLSQVASFNKELRANGDLHSDAKVVELMDLGRKLAKNMKEAKDPIFWGGPVGGFGGGIRKFELAMAAPGGMNLTGGGAQDFGFVRKIIHDGYVPGKDAFLMEGFLGEFNLSLSEVKCDKLVCVHPAIQVDAENQKLFVQLAMNSNVTAANFKRKPLNLSIVLDISGSMEATDNTEKSRLEWAKEAVLATIDELNEQDVLSIVLFDDKSQVLVPAGPVTDKKELIRLVTALKTQGSTNLDAGLNDGYSQVSQNLTALEGFEHRVILISDAGLNTGVVDQAQLLKTITNYAGENVGLTAIGLGLNFNQDFIHGITQSHGGNYLFVHSGKDMYRFFESFDFLVTPVAYNFKVGVKVQGVEAELVQAYGLPISKGETAKPFLDIQTLFFSQSGGALLLEYDLK